MALYACCKEATEDSALSTRTFRKVLLHSAESGGGNSRRIRPAVKKMKKDKMNKNK